MEPKDSSNEIIPTPSTSIEPKEPEPVDFSKEITIRTPDMETRKIFKSIGLYAVRELMELLNKPTDEYSVEELADLTKKERIQYSKELIALSDMLISYALVPEDSTTTS